MMRLGQTVIGVQLLIFKVQVLVKGAKGCVFHDSDSVSVI